MKGWFYFLLWVDYRVLLEVLKMPWTLPMYMYSKYIFTYTEDVAVRIPPEIKQCYWLSLTLLSGVGMAQCLVEECRSSQCSFSWWFQCQRELMEQCVLALNCNFKAFCAHRIQGSELKAQDQHLGFEMTNPKNGWEDPESILANTKSIKQCVFY